MHVVSTILRLITFMPLPIELKEVVANSLSRLEAFEKGLQLEPTAAQCAAPKAPHTSNSLWHSIDASAISFWGYCVENLWRAAMSTDEASEAWGALTSRLLIWRAIVGDTSQVGEWARREVVLNLSS